MSRMPFSRVAISLIAAAVGAAHLLFLSMPAAAQVPVIAEEIPPPSAAIEELQADIRRLEKELQGLGKLADAADKKKKDDARKPTFNLTGQMQADQVYFGQDAVSRAAIGDLQDGAQFRRLRIGARGTAFEVFEYSFGVDFALANNPSYLDN